MERGNRKVRGDYASAYKLSGPGSTLDKKSLRVHRRSMEQKELRQVVQNKNRPLADLSPVQEGDMSTGDKHYENKTPLRSKGGASKSGKQNDRFEQLMKWKKERELKKKLESQSKSNPVFRVTKTVDHGDLTLFKKSSYTHRVPESTRTVKPRKAAKQATTIQNTTQKTTEARSRNTTARLTKTDPSVSNSRPTTRIRQTSGNNTQPPAKKQKENLPPRTTRQNPGHSAIDKTKTTKEPPAKTTRQSSKSKAAVVQSKTTKTVATNSNEPEQRSRNLTVSDLSKVNTGRGDMSVQLDSFAPAEFSFNMSSFVFKPLSPSSAAGFLFPGQDNSCASFLETNPKRASTPKREKDVKRSSGDVAKVTNKFSDTLNLENTKLNMNDTAIANADETLKTKPSSRRPKRQSSAVSHTTNTAADQSTAETKPVADVTMANLEETVVDLGSSSRRSARLASRRVTRSSQRSINDSGMALEDSLLSNDASVLIPTKSSDGSEKHHTRSRSRRSLVTSRTEERDGEHAEKLISFEIISEGSSAKAPDKEKPAYEQTDSNSAESSADEVFKATPKVSARRSVRKSILSTKKSFEEANDDTSIMNCTPKSALKKGGSRSNVKKHVTLSEDWSSEGSEEERGTRKSARNARRSMPSMPSPRDAKKSSNKKHRKSMLPRLPKSPEEWVDLLSNSPMIEMTRRTPKAVNTSVPAINFEDGDLEQPNFSDTDSGTPVPMETQSGDSAAPVCSPSSASRVASPAPASPGQTIGLRSSAPSVVSPAVSIQEEEPAVSTSKEAVMAETATASTAVPKASSPKATETVQFCEVSSTQGPSDDSSTEEHDVKYFRNKVVAETSRLNSLCELWGDVNKDKTLTEDVHGQIRTTVGQAQLLMDQRFKQFTGLVDNCEFQQGEKETTCTDLQGFWDMVYFQVEDVDAKFQKLEKLQSNNWKEEEPIKVRKPKKKVEKPAVVKPVVKSKFAAFRAQMKKQQSDPTGSPALPVQQEEKVFEIPGFFRVASPVRTPKFHCHAGTPKKATPVSATQPNKEEPKPTSTSSVSNTGRADNIIHRISTRKSYVPIVPSPLLQDTTPLPRPTRACTQKTPASTVQLDSGETIIRDSETGESPSKRIKTTPVRHNLRQRKSVNFVEEVEDFKPLDEPQTPGESVEDDVMDVSHDSFSKYLQPANSSTTEGCRKRRRSSLKGCKSNERRRSRSVHFASPGSEDMTHVRLPRTPFNRNSIVKQKRVTRRSVTEQDVFSKDNIDNDENTPPASTSMKAPRPSLLYTPPEKTRSPKVNPNVPTGILISFSP